MINGLPGKLQQLRLHCGLSQKQVANQLNLSPSIVSGYENGSRTPSADVLLQLSYLYKCSTDFLLGKVESAPACTLDVTGLSTNQIHALQNLIETLKA